ncbi:MAG: hypothetical protein HFG28_10640 [Eubacterium sp.]|nr:hypothetical protein [Eubacterium sp.]
MDIKLFDSELKVMSVLWHSKDKYRRVIFQCNRKFKNDKKCRTPHLTEDEIKEAFVKAVNTVIPEKDELIANTKVMMRTLCDTSELEQSRLLTEMDTVAAMVERIVAENKAAAMDQEEYQRRRNELVARYEAARDGYEKASGEISGRGRGKPICGLSAGCKSWTAFAESLMRSFGRRSLTTPRFMPGMTSASLSRQGTK